MRQFKLLALLILMFSLAFSCEKDENEERSVTVQNLVGTWEDYWEEGWHKDSANPSENETWNEAVKAEDKSRFTFKADNTGILETNNNSVFTWSLNGNKMTITSDGFTTSLTILNLTKNEFIMEGYEKRGTVESYEKLNMRRVK